MRRILLAFVILCGLAARAEAVSLRDLVDLARQGTSDELLIALVEAEKSVFHLSPADIKQLKADGLSDRLLIHLLQTPTLRPAPEPTLHIADARPRVRPSEAPAVVIVNHVETVAVPVYVAVPVQRSERKHRDDEGRKEDKASPVYWGYGGKLRPGSWKDR
jgi:hypothetical protein